MRFAEINKKFTAKVAEYIAEGWTINAGTMNGSQGEIAKVDMTNGKDVIRVMLDTDYTHERNGDRFYCFDKVRLIVGRPERPIRVNESRDYDTIWNNHLDVIYCEEFYKIGCGRPDWYGTKEETMAAQDKNLERYIARQESPEQLPDKAKGIILPMIRRMPKCKSVTVREIGPVIKSVVTRRNGQDTIRYTAEVRGQRVALN